MVVSHFRDRRLRFDYRGSGVSGDLLDLEAFEYESHRHGSLTGGSYNPLYGPLQTYYSMLGKYPEHAATCQIVDEGTFVAL